MKVKIFAMMEDYEQLEKDMEAFVSEIEGEGYHVSDVKYSTEFETNRGELYSAMIIYDAVDFFTS